MKKTAQVLEIIKQRDNMFTIGEEGVSESELDAKPRSEKVGVEALMEQAMLNMIEKPKQTEEQGCCEGYVSMDIPKCLEEQILNLIQWGESGFVNPEKMKELQEQIHALQDELAKAKASIRRRPKVSKEIEEEIVRLRKEGLGMNKIAKRVRCGDGTVRRVLKDYGIS